VGACHQAAHFRLAVRAILIRLVGTVLFRRAFCRQWGCVLRGGLGVSLASPLLCLLYWDNWMVSLWFCRFIRAVCRLYAMLAICTPWNLAPAAATAVGCACSRRLGAFWCLFSRAVHCWPQRSSHLGNATQIFRRACLLLLLPATGARQVSFAAAGRRRLRTRCRGLGYRRFCFALDCSRCSAAPRWNTCYRVL